MSTELTLLRNQYFFWCTWADVKQYMYFPAAKLALEQHGRLWTYSRAGIKFKSSRLGFFQLHLEKVLPKIRLNKPYPVLLTPKCMLLLNNIQQLRSTHTNHAYNSLKTILVHQTLLPLQFDFVNGVNNAP